MRAVYTGHEALTFTDYLDLDTGRTLTAEPGGTYDITPASGRLVEEMPGRYFAPVDAEAWEQAQAAREEAERLAAESAAAESAADDGAPPDGEAPGPEEGQQF